MNNSTSKYSAAVNRLSLVDIYIQQLFEFYRQRYLQDKSIQHFVKTSTRIPEKLRHHSFMGLCDRTVGLQLPQIRTLEGGAMRGTLKQIGLLLTTGGELFRGCVVFPIMDDNDQVIAVTGIRYGKRVRSWQLSVIQWIKPERNNYIKQGMQFVNEVIYGKA